MSDEPQFAFPEDTIAGSSERLTYYSRQLVQPLVNLCTWMLDHLAALIDWIERR